MSQGGPVFAAFSEAEHRERLARARASLADAGFAGCVSVAPEHLYYLAGYDSWVSVNSPQALVFTTGDDAPTLLVRNVDRPLAAETSWLDDVREYHLHADDAPALIAGIAREKGMADGRVAVELQSYALPHAFGIALEAALAPARVADATGLLGDLRLIKSAREMDYLREAADFASIGLAAARRSLRPGMTEIALAGEVERAMRLAGSDFWAVPTELASGPRTPGGHATPRERLIEPGDLVHLEFAGVSHRYHAVAVHTMAAGEPGPRVRQVYDIARASLAAGIAVIEPGVPVDVVEEASLEPLAAAGLVEFAQMRFGYGIGVAYPPIWLESLQISRGFVRRLEPGMVFVLHACIELPDEGIGIVQGGTYALTDDGPHMLVGGGDVAFDVL